MDACSALCENPHMLELMVPLPLPKKERVCAEQVAKELDLKTELVCLMITLLCSARATDGSGNGQT